VPDCEVEAEERPWCDSPDNDDFLDILARKKTLSLAIECKKRASEALTFLDTLGVDMQTSAAVASRQRIKRDNYYVGRSTRGRIHLAPSSWEALYCVASSDPGTRLLEPEAGFAARAAETIAREENETTFPERGETRPVIPVLVTTSTLFRLRYDPVSVSLETGHLPDPDEWLLEEIPFIRFTKPFFASPNGADPTRTVFIVSATNLTSFLSELRLL